MKVENALSGVQSLFLDTAPVIYYVEANPNYVATASAIFASIDAGTVLAICSPVTLAECLVFPLRTGNTILQQKLFDLLCTGRNTRFILTEERIAVAAARLRADHNITLTDAIQFATAFSAGCDAFLTNDRDLRRVTGINVLLIEDLIV